MKCNLHSDRDAVGVCTVCGSAVCAECRKEVAGTLRCTAHATATPAPALSSQPEKSGFWTVVLSFLPGLGHIYLGAYQRGLFLGGLFAALVVVNSHGAGGLEPLFGIATAFLWFFAIIDALRIRRAINSGSGDVSGSGILAPAIPKRSTRASSLTWGIILVGIGSLWVLNDYVDLDKFFDYVSDHIGFIFIGLGLILIAGYARRRSKERDAEALAAPPDASMTGPRPMA